MTQHINIGAYRKRCNIEVSKYKQNLRQVTEVIRYDAKSLISAVT